MSDLPLVSILCGCYNQSPYILESLNSITNQTYQNYEIIIWDDASSDDSVNIIERWISENSDQTITFIKHEKNAGICKSLNECYLLSKGKYIQMLALDDILLPHKLERHVQMLENSSSNYALVFSDAYLIDEHGRYFQNKFIARYKNYLSIQSGNFWKDLVKGNFIPAMSVLIKREIIEVIGLWDENLPYEDYDMWLRIARKYCFLFDDKTSVNYRIHANNTHAVAGIDRDIWFNMFIKHIDDTVIKEKVHSHVVSLYLTQSWPQNIRKYYRLNPPKLILDFIIAKRLPTLFYRIINKFVR